MALAEYKNTMLRSMADALCPAGFRKSGMKFTRTLPEVVQIVSLQSSTDSSATLLRATANLGIWVSCLAAEDQKPDILAAHWRIRIGQLMPNQSDKWWEISSDEGAEVSARELGSALTNFALLTFDALTTNSAIGQLWKSGRSPGLTKTMADRYLARLEEKTADKTQ